MARHKADRSTQQPDAHAQSLIDFSIDGNEQAVRDLLDAGIDPNYRSSSTIGLSDGRGTALGAALVVGQFSIADLLVQRGAKCDFADSQGVTPPFRAVNSEQGDDALAWLAKHQALGVLDKDGNTLLHQAAGIGSLNAVNFLIGHGADVNACNRHNWTPLHDACGLQSDSIMLTLLSHGADPTIRSRSGFLPIHSLKTIESILTAHEHGLNLTEPFARGMGLVHLLDKHKNTNCLRTLLALGYSAEGVYGVTREHEEMLGKSALANALDTKNAMVVMAHLTKFGAPSPEDLKLLRATLSRNLDLKSVVEAFMVRQTMKRIQNHPATIAP